MIPEEQKTSFIKSLIPHKGTAFYIFLGIFLILGIAGTVYLVQSNKLFIFKSKASSVGPSLKLTENISAEIGQNFDTDVLVYAESKNILGVDVVATFDKDMLTVSDITPKLNHSFDRSLPIKADGTFDKDKVIQKANSSGTIEFGMMCWQDGNCIQGITNSLSIATIKFTGKKTGTSKIFLSFNPLKKSLATDSNILGSDSKDLLDRVTNSTVIIRQTPQPTPTPTPSATPTPTPSATPSPAPSPTPTPSPSPTPTPTESPVQTCASACNYTESKQDVISAKCGQCDGTWEEWTCTATTGLDGQCQWARYGPSCTIPSCNNVCKCNRNVTPAPTASPIPAVISPTTTLTISPSQGYKTGDTVTLNFSATAGTNPVKTIHTSVWPGITNASQKTGSGNYQGFNATFSSRQAVVPFYVEYLSSDTQGNLETTKSMVVK